MIISLNNYTFEYLAGTKALSVDSFRLHRGEKLALVGRNGSGKSTLLLALAGLLDDRSTSRSCAIAREKQSLVFQSVCLDKKLTVEENLNLFAKVWGLSKVEINRNLVEISETLKMTDLLKRNVGSLSGGQQRRADLARALMIEPEVIFLDEPTGGLDVIAQREFWSALGKAQQKYPDLTIVCASHHGNELNLFERFVFLEKGLIQLDVSRESLVGEAHHETIEISTPNCSQLQEVLKKKLNIDAILLFDDKLMSHSNSAAETIEKMKALTDFETLVESVTVRRTSLADVILKKLLDLSAPFENHESLSSALTEVAP
ncbi:MAG: hypothetical protein RJB13_618 [Pseudomonadota bacterium]|jgi:ABC-type multidrug transport system ATPase subunit